MQGIRERSTWINDKRSGSHHSPLQRTHRPLRERSGAWLPLKRSPLRPETTSVERPTPPSEALSRRHLWPADQASSLPRIGIALG